MNLTLVVRPEVDDDLREVASWYDAQELETSSSFVLYSPISVQNNFSIIADTVVVYAVIHASRHDRHWKSRIEEFDFQH